MLEHTWLILKRIYTVFFIRTAVTRDRIIVLTSFIASLASAMTTVTATFFLVLKIVLVTRKSRMQHSYTKAMKIIVESGALVSMLMLAEALLQLASFVHTFDLSTSSGKVLTQLLVYTTSIHTPIIVCCLSLLSSSLFAYTILPGHWAYTHCLPRGRRSPSNWNKCN